MTEEHASAGPPPGQGGAASDSALRSLLRIPVFRRLWLAITVSSLGDWLGLLATTAMAQQLTREESLAVQGAAISGVILSSRPVARLSSAQVLTASTFTLPSAPVNRNCRAKRAPLGSPGTQVSPVTVSPRPTLLR